MKNSKRAKRMTRILCFLLAVFIGNMTITAAAKSNTVQEEKQNEILVSSTAGQHGVYEYDEETDSMLFIPPEEYITGEPSSGDDADFDQETDEELFDILSSVATATEKGAYEPVNSPSGVEASTCLIGARFLSGTNAADVKVGTGWLINNTYVVTAGHCLYDPKYANNGHDGYAMHVAVYVGASGGTAKQYRLGHVKTVGGDFKKYADEANYTTKGMYDDWGVIKLDSAVTVNVSKLKLRVVNGFSSMKGKKYTTVGYPSEYGENANTHHDKWNEYRMYRTTGTFYQPLSNPYSVSNAEPNYIGLVASSDLQFQEGQSGAAVYTTENGVAYGDGIVVSRYLINSNDPPVPCVLYINQWLYNYLTGLL